MVTVGKAKNPIKNTEHEHGRRDSKFILMFYFLHLDNLKHDS